MDFNAPPLPVLRQDSPKASLIAYVWRGDKFDEIGLAMTAGDSHLVRFALGVDQREVVELRGVDPAFYPAHLQGNVPQPTFLAFLAGTAERAGTAWPHPDGKGHRLKLRQSLEDGAAIELKASGHYSATADHRSTRKRKPNHRPKINA